MQESGIITGATTHINYKIFGYKAVAHILINIDSQLENQLVEYLKQMPDVYSYYSRGVKGNWDIIVTLKTLEHLNDIKDAIKRQFPILEMRSAIWTDVKEMNYNLVIASENQEDRKAAIDYQVNALRSSPRQVTLDKTDMKIADRLALDGRVPMEALGKEIGASCDTAKRRYEKLKANGVLKVTIQVNPFKMGYRALCVFFTVTSHENSFGIIEEISHIPDVISIMKTSGDYDLQIWAMAKDLTELFAVQSELGKIQGITKIDAEVLTLENFEKWPSPRQCISTF